ncbi:MAG: hypothetical protein ABFD91_18665 [Anaerohalosphaeraceae bacterium]
MITTKTQIKPKHTYLYTYTPIYLHPVNSVNPVKNNNFSYPSVSSMAKNMFLQNKANLIRRAYVESRHAVHPRGTKAGRACQF